VNRIDRTVSGLAAGVASTDAIARDHRVLLTGCGIEPTLTVGLFSYACWLAWIPFLPKTFWDSISRVRR